MGGMNGQRCWVLRPLPSHLEVGAQAETAALVLNPGLDLCFLPQPWPDSAQTPQECWGWGTRGRWDLGSRGEQNKEVTCLDSPLAGPQLAEGGPPRVVQAPVPTCCVTLGVRLPVSGFLGRREE